MSFLQFDTFSFLKKVVGKPPGGKETISLHSYIQIHLETGELVQVSG